MDARILPRQMPDSKKASQLDLRPFHIHLDTKLPKSGLPDDLTFQKQFGSQVGQVNMSGPEKHLAHCRTAAAVTALFGVHVHMTSALRGRIGFGQNPIKGEVTLILYRQRGGVKNLAEVILARFLSSSPLRPCGVVS